MINITIEYDKSFYFAVGTSQVRTQPSSVDAVTHLQSGENTAARIGWLQPFSFRTIPKVDMSHTQILKSLNVTPNKFLKKLSNVIFIFLIINKKKSYDALDLRSSCEKHKLYWRFTL